MTDDRRLTMTDDRRQTTNDDRRTDNVDEVSLKDKRTERKERQSAKTGLLNDKDGLLLLAVPVRS